MASLITGQEHSGNLHASSQTAVTLYAILPFFYAVDATYGSSLCYHPSYSTICLFDHRHVLVGCRIFPQATQSTRSNATLLGSEIATRNSSEFQKDRCQTTHNSWNTSSSVGFPRPSITSFSWQDYVYVFPCIFCLSHSLLSIPSNFHLSIHNNRLLFRSYPSHPTQPYVQFFLCLPTFS